MECERRHKTENIRDEDDLIRWMGRNLRSLKCQARTA